MDVIEVTERPGVHPARRALGAASSVLWVVAAGVLGWLLWPSSLGGCTTLTIVSGHSMEPTYYTGDLVIARCGDVQVGDVIVYSPPEIPGSNVIHRIVDGNAADGWIVQGDNNDFLDPWQPKAENIHGSAAVHIPHLGAVASILVSPMTWISLLVIALAVVVWPAREEDDPSQDGDSGDESAAGPGGPDGLDALDEHLEALGEEDAVPAGALALAVAAPAAPPASAEVAQPRGLLTRLRGRLASLPVPPAAARPLPSPVVAPRGRARRAGLSALVLSLLLVPLGAGAGVANAAQLLVHAGSLETVGDYDRCSGTTVPVTAGAVDGAGTATTVVVTIPAGCHGRSGVLRLVGASGALAATDTPFALPGTGTAATVTVPAYTASSVTDAAMTLGTWGMRTGWTYTPPAQPITAGNGQTVVQSVTISTQGGSTCATVSITTNTANQSAWRAHLNIAASPWNGATSTYTITSGQVRFDPSATPVNGVIGIVGTVNGWDNLTAGQSRSFTVCRS